MLFLQDELRYDTHHTKADRIYRVVQGGVDFLNANTVYPMAPAMVQEFPEIEQAVRFRKHAGVVLQHDDIHFVEDRFYFADSTVFDPAKHPCRQYREVTRVINAQRLGDRFLQVRIQQRAHA